MRVNKDKFKDMVELVNTSEKKVKKMNYKQKQRYYEAKNIICHVFHDSTRKGTYIRLNSRGNNGRRFGN